MTLKLKVRVMFDDRGSNAVSYVTACLRGLHRKQVADRMSCLIESGELILPMSLADFSSNTSDAYGKSPSADLAYTSFVGEHVRFMPLYLEYVRAENMIFRVSTVFIHWPFAKDGESLEMFKHCWEEYGRCDMLINQVVDALVSARRHTPNWKCTDDAYFKSIWNRLRHDHDDRRWQLKYFPLDVAMSMVDQYRQRQTAKATRLAELDKERSIGNHFFKPRTQGELDTAEASDKKYFHFFIIRLLETVVANKSHYEDEAYLNALLVALFQRAGVDAGNMVDARDWLKEFMRIHEYNYGGVRDVLEHVETVITASK